jgi:asparagine synthase (glutamine-hydrolysing)
MCGIAGLFLRHPADEPGMLARAGRMADALAHRGPDGSGAWADPAAGLALSQRRLAIIDLSPGGAQPMLSACGRWAITYNGELYNYRELRAELTAAGSAIRGDSDTAVLLEAIARWGIEAALPRLDAMFAFALWDRERRELWLARDQVGIKPLVYAETTAGFLFGSDLTALEAAGGWTPTLDPGAISAFLARGCIPAPLTAFREARKLPPGGLLRVGADGSHHASLWFDARAVAREAMAARHNGSAEAIAEELDALLQASVGAQMVADVGVGAFLSGGIDSSAVTAAMAAASPGNARAFTIGFDDPAFDESAEAAAVANHLGVRHRVLRATASEAIGLVERLPSVFDEPFADPSALPTLLLARLTRAEATVALSGDGGDELFGGYRRHLMAARHWPRLSRLPLRRAAGRLLAAVPSAWWDGALAKLPGAPRRPGETLRKLGDVLRADDLDAAYARMLSPWPADSDLGGDGIAIDTRDLPDEPLARMRVLDLTGYLHDDVLTKVDRAAMAVALEVRVPMLSPRLIRFAFRLPPEALVRDGRGKAPLRDVLAKRMPRSLFEREKTGFGVPVDTWLRGPLRTWAGDLLASAALRRSGFVDSRTLDAAWGDHQSGRRDLGAGLWSVAMLAGWLASRMSR